MIDGLGEIRQELASLRRETDQRHADNRIQSDTRHREILDRFERTNGSIGKAHDRAAALEAVTAYLRTEWTLIRDRYHAMLNRHQSANPDDHPRTVNWSDLRALITVIIACISGTALMLIWILHVVGKL